MHSKMRSLVFGKMPRGVRQMDRSNRNGVGRSRIDLCSDGSVCNYHKSSLENSNRSMYTLPTHWTSFVNNEFMPVVCGESCRKEFHNLKPSTGEVLGTVSMASREDVGYAVSCAKQAFEENQDRSRVYISQAFNEAANLIDGKYKEELAYLEALGKLQSNA